MVTGAKPYKIVRGSGPSANYRTFVQTSRVNTGTRYPQTVLRYGAERGLHPTQKPAALCEYLIRTYTTDGATVLDCCMGSGTTGVAAVNTGRSFIGIEREPRYFETARDRIAQAERALDRGVVEDICAEAPGEELIILQAFDRAVAPLR